MTNKEKKNILNEIVERLKKNINVKEIIIFGSYTNDSIKQDSDLDMLVILDEEGVVKNYKEKLERRRRVTSLLNDYRKRIPLDVLVYSSEEWEKLKLINSSLVKEINMNGMRIS